MLFVFYANYAFLPILATIVLEFLLFSPKKFILSKML